MSNYRRRLIITHNIYELVHSWDKDSVRNGYVVDNVRNVDNVDPVDFLIKGSIINDGTYINIAKGSYSVSISPGKQYFNEDFYIDVSAIVNDTNTDPNLVTGLLDLGSVQNTADSSAAIALRMSPTTFSNNAKFYDNSAGTAATITKNPSLGYIDMQYRVGVEKISDAYSHSFISLGGQKTYGINFARKKIGEDVPWMSPWMIGNCAINNTQYVYLTDIKIRYIKIYRRKL